MANTLRITYCSPLEGQLREVHGEDSLLHVFDTVATAEGVDGKRYIHNTFLVPGAVEGPDGWLPNRNYRDRAEAFCQRVEARGVIDLAHWHEVRESTWAEREAYNLKCEADERAWGVA